MKDFPYVAPPPDGLHQALTDARGRRLRSAGLSSTAAALALCTVAVLLGGTSTQSLVQQPAPEQPAVSRLVPGPATDDAGTLNTVSTVTSSSAPSTAAGSDRLAGVQPAAHDGEAARRTGGARGAASDPPYAAGRITRSDGLVYLPTDPRCNVTGKTEDATTLCPNGNAYASGTGVYTLYGEVCSTRTDTTWLHFDTDNEVDFTIRRGTAEVWRWSRWHPAGGKEHTVAVETGACSQWSFDWTGVDASGTKLPKGDYTLRTTFLARELQSRSTVTYTFTIS